MECEYEAGSGSGSGSEPEFELMHKGGSAWSFESYRQAVSGLPWYGQIPVAFLSLLGAVIIFALVVAFVVSVLAIVLSISAAISIALLPITLVCRGATLYRKFQRTFSARNNLKAWFKFLWKGFFRDFIFGSVTHIFLVLIDRPKYLFKEIWIDPIHFFGLYTRPHAYHIFASVLILSTIAIFTLSLTGVIPVMAVLSTLGVASILPLATFTPLALAAFTAGGFLLVGLAITDAWAFFADAWKNHRMPKQHSALSPTHVSNRVSGRRRASGERRRVPLTKLSLRERAQAIANKASQVFSLPRLTGALGGFLYWLVTLPVALISIPLARVSKLILGARDAVRQSNNPKFTTLNKVKFALTFVFIDCLYETFIGLPFHSLRVMMSQSVLFGYRLGRGRVVEPRIIRSLFARPLKAVQYVIDSDSDSDSGLDASDSIPGISTLILSGTLITTALVFTLIATGIIAPALGLAALPFAAMIGGITLAVGLVASGIAWRVTPAVAEWSRAEQANREDGQSKLAAFFSNPEHRAAKVLSGIGAGLMYLIYLPIAIAILWPLSIISKIAMAGRLWFLGGLRGDYSSELFPSSGWFLPALIVLDCLLMPIVGLFIPLLSIDSCDSCGIQGAWTKGLTTFCSEFVAKVQGCFFKLDASREYLENDVDFRTPIILFSLFTLAAITVFALSINGIIPAAALLGSLGVASLLPLATFTPLALASIIAGGVMLVGLVITDMAAFFDKRWRDALDKDKIDEDEDSYVTQMAYVFKPARLFQALAGLIVFTVFKLPIALVIMPIARVSQILRGLVYAATKGDFHSDGLFGEDHPWLNRLTKIPAFILTLIVVDCILEPFYYLRVMLSQTVEDAYCGKGNRRDRKEEKHRTLRGLFTRPLRATAYCSVDGDDSQQTRGESEKGEYFQSEKPAWFSTLILSATLIGSAVAFALVATGIFAPAGLLTALGLSAATVAGFSGFALAATTASVVLLPGVFVALVFFAGEWCWRSSGGKGDPQKLLHSRRVPGQGGGQGGSRSLEEGGDGVRRAAVRASVTPQDSLGFEQNRYSHVASPQGLVYQSVSPVGSNYARGERFQQPQHTHRQDHDHWAHHGRLDKVDVTTGRSSFSADTYQSADGDAHEYDRLGAAPHDRSEQQRGHACTPSGSGYESD